ncbi:MAG: lysophospholipase [Clostridiales bacterium]|nr:lysophospholipase [Clostridiales bacterium]
MQLETTKIPARDGAQIHTLLAFPDDAPRGIVIVNHGFGEHSGSYAELLEQLTAAGYLAAIFDHRGHGEMNEPDPKKREKLRGVLPDYQSFLDDIGDVAAALMARCPGLPLALYGHSMGGNIAVNYLLQTEGHPFSCAILESPWLGLCNPVSPAVAGLAKFLGKISPKFAIYNKLSYSDITSEPKSADALEKDPLYHNRISFRMFAGINAGCAHALEGAAKLTTPTYLAYAADEKIVCNTAIESFGRDSGDNVSLHPYASHHAIHSDINRAQYYQDILAFLDANL